MANNFRKPANLYISKAGDSGASGNTPDYPQLALSGNEDSISVMLGTGMYTWPTGFIYGRQGFNNVYLQADGRVVVLGDGQTRYQWLTAGGCVFEDLRFEQFAGFQFAHSPSNAPVYRRCEFVALPATAGSANSGAIGGCTFEDCVFENVHFSNGQTPGLAFNQGGDLSGVTFVRCLFFNCTFGSAARVLRQCYFDPRTAAWGSAQPQYGTEATGNNVDPAADLGQGYGLRLDNDPVAHGWPHNLSQPPLFNALAQHDYSVQAGSPHLAAGIGPRQYRQGRSFVVQAPAPGQAADPGNTRFVPQDGADAPVALLGVAGVLEGTAAGALGIRAAVSPAGTATLRTDRVRHSAGLPREISYLQTLGGDNFNTSYPALESQLNPNAPEVFNNNVPDVGAYPAGHAGRNPNRLSYRLRWSTLPDPRLDHPEDWATGTELVECEWNTRPLYNPATNIGNGRPDFVVADGRPIICTWYQLEVGLTNLYYH
jgi:hypothetical protein